MNISELHKELKFRMSRSSGSGGQHVNKVSTRVELLFDVINSQVLNEAQKTLIQERLGNRITQDGILQLISDTSRSQLQNKNKGIKKFDHLIEAALKPRKARLETGAFKANKHKRLTSKKRQGEKKSVRRKIDLPSGTSF